MWTSFSLHEQTWQHHPLVVSWLWSFTRDASKSELEGFLSNYKPIAVSQTHQLKHGVGPRQLPAQHGLARGQVPWLAGVASGVPLLHPETQIHTTVLSLLAWFQVDPLSKWLFSHLFDLFKCSSDLEPAWEMCHFMAWGSCTGLQGSSAWSQWSQPGRSRAHRLSCLEGWLRLWIALRPSSQILQSCLAKPFCDPLASSHGGGSAAYIYTCVCLCVSVYIHLCTNMCGHMYVCVQFGEMH